MEIKEDLKKRKKVSRPVGTAKVGAVGVAVFVVVLGSLRISIAKGMNIQDN